MIRKILCAECNRKSRPQYPEDVARGWKWRTVQIQIKKPEVHQIKMIADGVEEAVNLPSIVCDICNAPLADGTPAYALTKWNTNREGEPGPWEKEFTQ